VLALTAVGTTILAFVAIVGLVAANSRLRRGTPSIEAKVFLRPGGSALHVSVTVQSTGLGRLKMVENEDNEPTIYVTQLEVRDGRETPVVEWQKPVLAGEVADPGESVQASRVFLVPPIDPETLGWDILFSYDIKRRWPSRNLWTFSATTFVPVPEAWRRGVEYKPGGNGHDPDEGQDEGTARQGPPEAV
jgi:hypothetical protein